MKYFFGFIFCVALFTSLSAQANDHADLLIFAPHPDDEVIGCSGVILRAMDAGKRVKVAVITNGDSFPKGVAAITGKPIDQLRPADYLALAKLRQTQSHQGVKVLGLKKADVIFLGYPNEGLAPMYRSKDEKPFHNAYTDKSRTYSLVTPDYHTRTHGEPAPYTKSALMNDLVELIQKYSPDEIYVTNELDQHIDHRAAMWFVRDAALRSEFQGTLSTFVVHGEKLPSEDPLVVELTPQQLRLKREAIRKHKIPKVHDDLVDKYAKPAELFWPIDLPEPSN